MTNAKKSARRVRHCLLVVGILYTLAAVAWIVWPLAASPSSGSFEPMGLMGTPLGVLYIEALGGASHLGLVFGLLILAQWAFLRPRRVLAMHLTTDGKPLRSAVIAAGAMAMFLTAGAVTLLLEASDWWEPGWDPPDGWRFALSFYGGMLLIWAIWAWVFFVYWRQGDRYTQLGRMLRGLIAGSVLEAIVAIPVHIWATRQRECYCVRGTYTTLVFSGVVLLWAFGPGIILLYQREKYRQAKLFPLCLRCGYNLHGNTSGVCPECGTKTPADENP